MPQALLPLWLGEIFHVPSIGPQPAVSCILSLSRLHAQLKFQLISHFFLDAFYNFSVYAVIFLYNYYDTIIPQIYPVIYDLTHLSNFIFTSLQPVAFVTLSLALMRSDLHIIRSHDMM